MYQQSQSLISLEEAEEYNIDLQEVTPLSAIASFWNKDAKLCGSMELGIYFAIEGGFAAYVWNGENYTAEFYSDEFTEADVIADIKATHAELNGLTISNYEARFNNLPQGYINFEHVVFAANNSCRRYGSERFDYFMNSILSSLEDLFKNFKGEYISIMRQISAMIQA